ncbi:Hsp20-like chaperones superfamily protein [Thalictrum thalictroides]|uniref:Hsp20-like chaperones superfamily protein n=1 Tax=Thalictrum thalictroides TaxID=46969 RepID=A0A7J6VD25_THATH|nr:Hsp20-like chaperones superfamily protein [Thalictrum thalictroides]
MYKHTGQKVFEWDQTIDEVNIYITLPPNVPTKLFSCKIQAKHVEVGIKGNPPYLNHDLTCPVKTDSSFWTLEDDIMHITLQKRDIGQTWASPILGQGQLDPVTTDLEQKRLMLQRFQEEDPDFDYRCGSVIHSTGHVVDDVARLSRKRTPCFELMA